MKIYDLDHLETIADDVTVFGGSEEINFSVSGSARMNFSASRSGSIAVNPLSISNYNTGNTVSSSTGIAAPTWKPRLNFIKTLSLVTPSALNGIGKVLTAASLIFKPKLLAKKIFA
jgi:hypothetical protein